MKKKMSMKSFSRLFNLLLAAVIVMGCACPIVVYAASKYTKSTVEDGWYRILHPASGKYVDVSNVSKENGACLHLWDKAEGNQNQIFHITRNADGTYVIIANHSKKAVEVRNYSMDDNGEVAQWDYGEVSSQQWRITRNEDKTFSFTNANSGLNMSVLKPSDEPSNNQNYSDDLDFANGLVESMLRSTESAIASNEDKEKTEKTYENGTKLIQHHEDNTVDDKFELIKLTDNDILSASWTADTHDLDLASIDLSAEPAYCAFGTIDNYSYMFTQDGKMYFPKPNKKQAVKIEYLSTDALIDLLATAAMKDSQGKALLKIGGENAWSKVGELSKANVYANIIYSIIDGCFLTAKILNTSGNAEWNKHMDAIRSALHSSNGLYTIDYINVEKESNYNENVPLHYESPLSCERYTQKSTIEYEEWNGKLKKVKGEWEYIFK